MIELLGVAKAYGGAPVAGPLSLSVPAGTFVALLGGSGSGKTTTLKMINGLVAPDAGEVTDRRRAHRRRRRAICCAGGSAMSSRRVGLFPHMTVAENIAVRPRLAGWDTGAHGRTPDRAARPGRPAARARRPAPAALSGGQRQRVGVARALAAEPTIMLMDEPFGALDPVTRDALGRDYRALHERLGLTTVMVTHDVMEAVLLADRIVVMAERRILADDTPGALLADHPDPAVRALMETPRRQAERVRGPGRGRGGAAGMDDRLAAACAPAAGLSRPARAV